MKVHNKIFSALLVAAMCLIGTVSASAQKFEADGIRFSVISSADRTVTVESYSNALEPSDYIPVNPTPAVPDAHLRKAGQVVTYDVVIPETVSYNGVKYSVVSISEGAFSHKARMASLEIPATVESIGNRAFEGCTSLKAITSYANLPQLIDASVFSGVSRTLALKVPAWTLALYDSTPVWQEFVNVSYFKIEIQDITELIRRFLQQPPAYTGRDVIYIQDVTELVRLYLLQTY